MGRESAAAQGRVGNQREQIRLGKHVSQSLDHALAAGSANKPVVNDGDAEAGQLRFGCGGRLHKLATFLR